MALGAVWITRRLERSKLGYSLRAIRENEDAAEAAGVDALGMKLRAMALSSFLTALGGTFYAQYFAYIDPTITFGPAVSIQGLLQAIVGGAGTVLGPLLGSFVLTPDLRAVARGHPRPRRRRRDGLRAASSSSSSRSCPTGSWAGSEPPAARVMADGSCSKSDGVTKRFGGLTAVNRFSLARRRRRDRRADRAQRRRQDHRLPPALRLPRRRPRAPSASRAPRSWSAPSRTPSAGAAWPGRSRSCSRSSNLTALENVMVGAFNRTDDVAGRARAGRRGAGLRRARRRGATRRPAS